MGEFEFTEVEKLEFQWVYVQTMEFLSKLGASDMAVIVACCEIIGRQIAARSQTKDQALDGVDYCSLMIEETIEEHPKYSGIMTLEETNQMLSECLGRLSLN